MNSVGFVKFFVKSCSLLRWPVSIPHTRLPVFLMGVLAGIQQLRRASPGFQVRAHKEMMET